MQSFLSPTFPISTSSPQEDLLKAAREDAKARHDAERELADALRKLHQQSPLKPSLGQASPVCALALPSLRLGHVSEHTVAYAFSVLFFCRCSLAACMWAR